MSRDTVRTLRKIETDDFLHTFRNGIDFTEPKVVKIISCFSCTAY
jgi:hypothetical protein